MPIDLMLPFSIILGLSAWVLASQWYIWPALRRMEPARAMGLLVLPHAFRYVGLMFLIPGVTAAPLDMRFAGPAAYGDVMAALLAIGVLILLRRGSSWTTPLLWVFNIFGLVDLLAALTLGLRYTADGDLGAAYFIPAVVVPMLLVSHAYVFAMLRRLNANSLNVETLNVRTSIR